MKKTLVALAVAAMAATSANAATVYEQDGTKVELGGSVRLFLGKTGKDQRGDLINDGSRLQLKASHELGNGLSAFGGYELRFKGNANSSNNTFGDPVTRDLYAGLAHKDVGKLSFGRQATNADDVLQDGAYYDSGAWGPLTTHANKSVKYRSAEWNGFSFGADYLFGNSNKDRAAGTANGGDKNGYGLAAFYNLDLGNDQKFDFAAGYTQDNQDDATTTDTVKKHRAWLAHVGYSFGPFSVAGNYGQYKDHYRDSSIGVKGKYALVDLSYQVIEPSRVFFQWEYKNEKGTDTKETIDNKYLVGVDYKLHKNVLTYAQYEHVTSREGVVDAAPEKSKDNRFGVGLRVFF